MSVLLNYESDPVSYVLSDLISRTNEDDLSRFKELNKINQLKNEKSKGKALLKFLFELNKHNEKTIYRLCDQLNGHVEFLQRLISDQRTQSLFLVSQGSGRTFLREATRDFMAEQCGKSTEIIKTLINDPHTPLYSINMILNGNFNPEQRTSVLRKLANEEHASNEELSVTLIQESLIVQCLLTYAKFMQKKEPAKASTEEMREAIHAEYEAEYQAKYAQLDAEFKETQMKMKTEKEIRDEIEEELRIEYDSRYEAMKKKLTEKIKKEYTPIKQEVVPTKSLDSLDLRLREQLVREAENKIRNQVIEDLTADIRDSLVAQLRPLLKREIKEDLEPKLRTQITNEQTPIIKAQLRKELELELEQSIEERIAEHVRAEETNKIRKSLQNEMKHQLKKDTDKMKKKLILELVPQIRAEEGKKLHDKLDEMKELMREEIRRELEATLPIKIRREEREKLKAEIRESVIDDVRDEVEREMLAKQQLSVPKWMEDSMRDDIRRELEQRNKELLRRKEAELRERVFNEIQHETMSEIYQNTSINTSFVPEKSINDYKELKEMFREELESEIRAKIKRENAKVHILTVEQENKIRSQLRAEIYNEIKDSVIETIRAQVNEEMRKKYEKQIKENEKNKANIKQDILDDLALNLHDITNEPPEITRFKLQIRSAVEEELRKEIERKLRLEFEARNKKQESSIKLIKRIRETVIEEIREEITNPSPRSPVKNEDVKKLTTDIVEFIKPEVERSIRTSFLELEHVDITPTKGVSEATIDALKAQIKNELKSKYLKVLKEQIKSEFITAKVKKLFNLICKALCISNISFSLSRFFKLTEHIATECIEIRTRYDIKGPIPNFMNDLYQHIQHIDEYKTHTRGLLTRQARAISDAQSENCANAWATWAKSLYKSMTGKEYTSENYVKLRMYIDDIQSLLTAQHTSRLTSPSHKRTPRQH